MSPACTRLLISTNDPPVENAVPTTAQRVSPSRANSLAGRGFVPMKTRLEFSIPLPIS
jgi:hypothetical protein